MTRLLFSFLGVTFLSYLPCTAEAQEKSSITVGLILPLSGPAATFGVPIKNGVEMAYRSLLPEVQQRIKLVYEDDTNSPKASVSALQKLLATHDADVIVSAASNTSKALAPLADSKKVPLIAIASDQEVVENRDFVVALWVTPDAESQLLVPEAIRRGYKKIAIISALHEGMLSYKRSFDKFNTGKIEVVIDEEYATDTADFKPFLNKLRSVGPVDAIFVNLFPGQTGMFARQARELGLSMPLFGCEMFESPDDVKLSQGALIGGWYAQADEGTSDFLNEYRSEYPSALTFGAANGYDVVGLVARALSEGRTSKEEINKFLHTLQNHTGALGTYSATSDNRFNLPAVLKVVTKDGFEKYIPTDE